VWLLTLAAPVRAQDAPAATPSIPRLITVTGTYQPASALPAPATAGITLSVYATASGGAPLFQETQEATLDATGRYTVQLGALQPDGLPIALFAAGEERWLGVQFAGPGDAEGPRRRLTSVPYALRAADAETLGGHPASAYVLSPTASGDSSTGTSSSGSGTTAAKDVQAGTVNTLAKYVTSVDVGDSGVVETGGHVGIGTSAPLDFLHVRYTNTNGGATGIAVQNLGNTTASYSGMLFYDQNGALGQFQGFNNVTHEYRINNIASSGSINFMTGSTSRFAVAPNGSIGIGTTTPFNANLDVSNATSGTGSTNINVTSYAANGFGGNLIGRKARGTEAAPTAVLNNDGLLTLSGTGYGATGFAGASSGVITMRASENWTDTAQGSYMNFSTTPNGTATSLTRMTINSNGNVGIGVFGAQANLEVSNANGASGAGTIFATSFTNAGTALFVGRRARGTGVAPTAVQNGDNLAGYLAQGYGTSLFSGTRGGMFVQAAENWSDAAQGTRVFFNTTATGTNTPSTKVTIDPSGNVGVGTFNPQAPLEVSRTGSNAAVASTLYTNGAGVGAFLVAQTARGTAGAPTAVQTGDFLGALLFNGYATTHFQEAAAVGALAAENFTDTARGTAIGLATTPLGGIDSVIGLTLLPSGNVGIGTPLDVNGIPTAADKLQVYGDIRVGAGAGGCVRDFSGTQIAGTCASDRRYKKNITPFGPTLDRVVALQPVHFFWRADEFPDQHFGDSQAYGLIAQDTERVLPELVVTREDGYKAIDYSKLPLLTLEAVKELKSQNDDLKAANDDLTKRVAELERLIKEIRSTGGSRR
jgi:hypothetical protein